MLRKLCFWFLSVGIVCALEIPSESVRISSTPANSFEDAFERGFVYGHIGALFQQGLDEAPTYGDLNFSIGYESRRFQGYKFGAEAWLIPKLYEAKSGDFMKGQTYFALAQLYADFYHQHEKFGATIGRYGINEEWMTHFTEGASLKYDLIPYIDLSLTWALRNAYITNYYVDNFSVFGEFDGYHWNGGAWYLKAAISIPQTTAKITPYFYYVPDFFSAPGVRGDVDLHITRRSLFKLMVHLMSYVELNGERKAQNGGSGGLIWAEGSFDFPNFRIGAGIINTLAGGAIYIDNFGQHTPFERTEGIFYYNATTPYGFISVNLWENYLSAYGALRGTFTNEGTILNWEAKLDMNVISNVSFGLAAIGVNNPTSAKTRLGQGDYMIFRGYAEFRF